ncbi:MAG: DUF4249 domain-containing protein [Bacteroidia bacterium]|nr:DUF4249 domain-containing protein [Bacteroidia bacterium]
MKQYFNKFIYILISALFLYSCEDVATNVKIKQVEKQIVVQCFISPDDDTVKAMLSWSLPVIGTSYSTKPELINNASVIIYNNNISDTLEWNNNLELYTISTSKFKINKGETYYLQVKLLDGKNVFANCTVPATQNNTLALYKVDSMTNSWDETIIEYTYKYNNHSNSQNNYYRISSEINVYSEYDEYVQGDFKSKNEIKNDNYYTNSLYSFSNEPIYVKAYIINSDYNYFQYHKTLQNAQNSFGIFSEPNIIFSNIKGGLGCFGAYYSYSVENKIR